MDINTIGIIVTILSIGFTIIGIIVGIGLTILGALGNNRFNKLSLQIGSVEIKMRGELSRINSVIGLLREQNAMKIEELDNHIHYRIKDLENLIHSSRMSVTPKKGESSDDEYARHTRPRSSIGNQRRT